ncbi:MAG: ABC transporter permease [Longimicrobiales bacterium]
MASWVLPRHRAEEWREDWLAELSALDRAAGNPGAVRLPSRLGFALGAFPHALWTAFDEWRIVGSLSDLRQAVRALIRSPAFALVAGLTLALGIGANASIFSLVNALVLRPPPAVVDADRLVQIARSYEDDPRFDNFSWPALKLIEAEGRVFEGVAAYDNDTFVLGQGRETEQLLGQFVTGSFFPVLGTRAEVGRLLLPSDDVDPGGHPVVVLAYDLWVRRYGADPDVVGRSVPLGNRPYEVVGVAPEGFVGVSVFGGVPDLWVPTMQVPAQFGGLPFEAWGWSAFNTVGRLREGVSMEAARGAMDLVSLRLREAASVNEGMVVLLEAGIGLDPEERAEAERVSGILLLIALLVLALTCFNVANLFLAKSAARQTEVGVRMALGAGRIQVARQFLWEAVLLGLLGAALAFPFVFTVERFLPLALPYAVSVPLRADGRVFGFLILVGLCAGGLFGAVPAWTATAKGVSGRLREGAMTQDPGRSRFRDMLVCGQLAISLALVAGAALLGRSVASARAVDPGFAPQNLTAASVWLDPTGRYDEQAGMDFYGRFLEAIRQLPGVTHASLANQMPIVGGHSRATVQPEGNVESAYEAEYVVVADDYFETMGIPVRSGRGLRDDEGEPVVVVNEALAAMFWPGEDALGKRLAGEPAMRVVGIVGNVHMRSLRAAPRPAAYYPASQRFASRMVLHVRTRSGQKVTADQVRGVAADLDPDLPIPQVLDLEAAVRDSLGETQTIGRLVTAFAGLALLLSAIGLYGLVSYGASRRVREMGIRSALGARPESLVALVLKQGLAVSLAGVAAGLVLAGLLGRALQGLLFGVGSADGVSLVASSLMLLGTAALAAWIPARRAGRVDAAVCLRE